ncbi:nucleotide sugar dehydrogenase [Streptomyces flavalbus]|uniref:Nucleotide sugar dehydrogenase n=1 Tax=Streptomyces flavalbus TaxID=2665155 RepID=A0ABW2W8J9_9ACTN
MTFTATGTETTRPPDPPAVRHWTERAGQASATPATHLAGLSVAVVGLGYVGLPTALALCGAGATVTGLDTSERRLRDIRAGAVDLLPPQHAALVCAERTGDLRLTADPAPLRDADAVVVCVPTPVTEDRAPDLRALRAACATVVRHAAGGQLIVLTSTSHVGSTRELLTEPLAARGLTVEEDVLVAFSPERVDPGNTRHTPERTPRVLGGAGPLSTRAATFLLRPTASRLHPVPDPETAEMAKLWENVFRAVNIALANELADACLHLGLAPLPVIEAAATKPYGFLPFYPGPGAGGHCIPCDPHYLLGQLPPDGPDGPTAPVTTAAMAALRQRPAQVARRAADLLRTAGRGPAGARVLVLGAAYKPGVSDVRESPAAHILGQLAAEGADVRYSDPFVPELTVDGAVLRSVDRPQDQPWDLVIVHTAHPGDDLTWLDTVPLVHDPRSRHLPGTPRAPHAPRVPVGTS